VFEGANNPPSFFDKDVARVALEAQQRMPEGGHNTSIVFNQVVEEDVNSASVRRARFWLYWKLESE
jgi:hypothetical protein